MENKINIAELLRDCPKGMELDCAAYDNVSFDKISEDKKATYPIFCYITDKEGNRSSISFTENGCESKRYGAKCVIFPKGKTTWEGFQRPFKDGDILFYKHKSNNVKYTFIYKRRIDMHYLLQYCGWFSEKPYLSEQFNAKERIPLYENDDIRFATEEEKEILFKAIKDNGYKWNSEAKTLEKLPKFKVGDKVKDKNNFIYTVLSTERWGYMLDDIYRTCVAFGDQDNYELVPNKFDINTLKPFENRVLVRNDINQLWIPAFWGYKVVDGFITTFGWCKYCIPYEGNEFLFKTNNDCDDFYKTWE